MRLGLFDPAELVKYANIPFEVNDAPVHRALAREAAQRAIVLLKNEGGLLPLPKDLASIAIIGPNADDLAVMLGNYNGTPSRAVTPLEGIRRAVSPATIVYTACGCEIAAGVPALEPIPSVCLRGLDGAAGQCGLAGAYFPNATFSGKPAFVRVDSMVDFAGATRRRWAARPPTRFQCAGVAH